jgi:hypothetical protein
MDWSLAKYNHTLNALLFLTHDRNREDSLMCEDLSGDSSAMAEYLMSVFP